MVSRKSAKSPPPRRLEKFWYFDFFLLACFPDNRPASCSSAAEALLAAVLAAGLRGFDDPAAAPELYVPRSARRGAGRGVRAKASKPSGVNGDARTSWNLLRVDA
jgi:hypothetical protein